MILLLVGVKYDKKFDGVALWCGFANVVKETCRDCVVLDDVIFGGIGVVLM